MEAQYKILNVRRDEYTMSITIMVLDGDICNLVMGDIIVCDNPDMLRYVLIKNAEHINNRLYRVTVYRVADDDLAIGHMLSKLN